MQAWGSVWVREPGGRVRQGRGAERGRECEGRDERKTVRTEERRRERERRKWRGKGKGEEGRSDRQA